MKKIMFNDRYGLTQAVLEGRKTMTRRIINIPSGVPQDFMDPIMGIDSKGKVYFTVDCIDGKQRDLYPQYQIGEELAVAQRYANDDVLTFNAYDDEGQPRKDGYKRHQEMLASEGYRNKMYVQADLMPHRIRTTDIKLERLQDISEDDAMCEGVFKYDKKPRFHEMDMFAPWPPYVKPYKYDADNLIYRCTARYAFAYLIDKVCGGGTWNRNPWVMAYAFKLMG